jgi:uncharacterized protein YcbX
MRIASLHRYPVKGLPGETLERVGLEPGEAFPQDRRFAFALGRSKFDPAAPDWLPKRNFACLMLHARLAGIATRFDAATQMLSLGLEGQETARFDLATQPGRAAAGAWMTAAMGADAEGEMRLAEAPGEAFADIRRKAVHIVGLGSVAELAARIGAVVDPRRFRANILLDGVPAFAELDWVGRDIHVGTAVLRVFDRTARCANTEVNPDTAERDLRPQRSLRDLYGHVDMGVYAEVVAGGDIAPGDTVRIAAD